MLNPKSISPKKYRRAGFVPALFPLIVLFVAASWGGTLRAQDPPAPLKTADPITVRVAVVIQNPPIPSMGNKRIHELFKTPGYTFQWHDPRDLMEAYRDTLNSVSGGAVKYEIVKIYDDSLFFTRLKNEEKLLSRDRVAELLAEPGWETLKEQGTSFDYQQFIAHYGFCEMRDRGEIQEVWLWTFPYGGTWESTFAGEGAFWLNSNPVEGTSCKDLLTVMGLNYEREMSLALESYGHRFESVMRKVYGRWDNKAARRNNWELFTSYDKVTPGKAHIGNIHFPPNGLSDYHWINETYVDTYADSWAFYPHVEETRPRRVNCKEWDCSHLGYMCWWYRHVPHFEGLNPADGHLNNWWHYVVDYNDALKREQKLRKKMRWKPGAASGAGRPFMSDLRAGADFPVYTTYAAAMERSSFILDQGYHFNYYTDSAGADFITDTGGDIGLGFRLDGQWVYRTRDMHRPPVILASYPDMVRYAFYPFEGVRVEGWFVVHSSRAAMLDLRIVNERKKKLQLEVVPFMRKSGESFRKTGQPFRNIQSEGSLIRFEHTELPDKWTLDHGVPYADSIRNVFMLSEQTECSGLFAAGETPSGEDSLIAFSRRVPLSRGDSSSLRIVRVVDTLGGKAPLEAEARQLMDQELGPYQQANEKLFARTPIPNFGDPEKDALYWSAVNMMRQVFYPPEGKSEYNYYVFSREPTWGWGHGGQVFHESITMLAYALIDPEGAMNSQRVYSSRQHPNGYINYRTGSYLDEVIEHEGELTSSAPWYAWLNKEIYDITGDREFLEEMYSSSKRFYEFYVAQRDKDQDGLCEWGGHAILESVRDSQVAVWDEVGWPAEFEGLDLNCMLVMEAKSLEAMARELGREDEAGRWKADHEKRTRLINETFWDPENGFYYHVDKDTHSFSHQSPGDLKRDEIIGFLPLWAGVASPEQAQLLVEKLTDPQQFWRPYGVPSLSAADSYYKPKGYWNGPVWVEWNYLVMQGLLNYGYKEEAKELVDRVAAGMIGVLKQDHNLWEFYSPDEIWGGYHKTYIWAGIINRMMMDVSAR